MWKQDKRQSNNFAPSKPQNMHRRHRNPSHEQSQDRQERQDRNDRSYNSGQNYKRPSYNRNQVIDSQGPEVKVKGTLSQLVEKYSTLARDAHLMGDRVYAENLFQHAEHYIRILNEISQEAAARAPEIQPQPDITPPAQIIQEQPLADIQPKPHIQPVTQQPEQPSQIFQSSQPIF
jgi:hypothetical protein